MRHWIRPATLLALLACHSDAFSYAPATVGGVNAGPDVQLTFNTDQDYWPMWTQDGRGILYAFVDAEATKAPQHRCLGLLPPTGGTRIWELCDNRAVRRDSLSSYSAYALRADGKLLVAESTSPTGFAESQHVTLWLADTASPYVRTTLLTLPVVLGTTTVTWLSDMAWTGPNAFVALAQQWGSVAHCISEVDTLLRPPLLVHRCGPRRDTLFADTGGVVLTGTITGRQATLQAVLGTEHATSFSYAEGGASIVFTKRNDLRLFKVPSAGGVPMATTAVGGPAPRPPLPAGELLGVACRGTSCIVARCGVVIRGSSDDDAGDAYYFDRPPLGPLTRPGPMDLHRFSLIDGSQQILRSNAFNEVFATPQISPVSGDVVVQVRGGWGHLRTFATAGAGYLFDLDGNSVLHLYPGMAAP